MLPEVLMIVKVVTEVVKSETFFVKINQGEWFAKNEWLDIMNDCLIRVRLSFKTLSKHRKYLEDPGQAL